MGGFLKTEELFMPAEDISRYLLACTYDGVDVWAEGEEDEIHVDFTNIHANYVWDTRNLMLTMRFYDLHGVVSYSMIAYMAEYARIVELFIELVQAARDCTNEKRPYVMYTAWAIRDPDEILIYTRPTVEYEEIKKKYHSINIITRIYPRK